MIHHEFMTFVTMETIFQLEVMYLKQHICIKISYNVFGKTDKFLYAYFLVEIKSALSFTIDR